MKDYSGVTITLRPEQEKAVKDTLKIFKNGTLDQPKKMLWNAKMRFGKTLTSYSLIRQLKEKEELLSKVLIITHRPDVNKAWSEDFNKINLHRDGWVYGSKSNSDSFEEVSHSDNYVWFASIQDLRGSYTDDNTSEVDFENLKKNDKVFSTEWDLIITDEAHEGTLTTLASFMYRALKSRYFLDLSGTPFNIIKADQWDNTDLGDRFAYDDQYHWSYPDERRAKAEWSELYPNDANPYSELPEIKFVTYDISKSLTLVGDNKRADINVNELFKTEEINGIDVFVYEEQVQDLLYKMLGSQKYSDSPELFPYHKKFNNRFNHTLWMLPNVPACNAMERLLNQQSSGFSGYYVVNATGEGTHSWYGSKDALTAVEKAIEKNKYTITLSQQMLTTGVTVPEWTAVFMMNNTVSPMLYMQTAFRVTSPGSLSDGRTKDIAYVFDFNPDRCLREIVEIATHNAKKSEKDDILEQDKLDRESIDEYLEYVSILSLEGSHFVKPNSEEIMERLNEVYVNEVIFKGFDSPKLWNTRELQNFDIEKAKLLEVLRKLQGNSVKSGEVTVSSITDEEREILKDLRKRELEAAKNSDVIPLTKDELSEKKKLEEASKAEAKNRQNAINVLTGVAARLPMLVFASPAEEKITPENFNLLIDDESWKEFMPKNLHRVMPEGTKSLEERQESLGTEGLTLYWDDVRRFFQPSIFSLASERIRQMTREADDKPVLERVIRIAHLFSNFKNPDKETVLTPWRVVNIQYNNTLGGLEFLDLENSTTDNILVWMKDKVSGSVESVHISKAITLLDEGSHEVSPKWVTLDKDIEKVWTDPKSTFFDINSKTALYPLFAAASLYYVAVKSVSGVNGARVKEDETWAKTVKRAIFVNCRVPYSKKIAQRVLAGYNNYEVNASVVDVISVRKLIESTRGGDKGRAPLSDEDKTVLWRWIFNPKDFRMAEARVEELKVKSESGSIEELLSKVKDDVEKSEKFTAVVSNPPYTDTNDNSSLYDRIMNVSQFIAEYISMIYPSRWQLSKDGGSSLAVFKNTEFRSKKYIKFFDYSSSDYFFRDVHITGGLCYFLWSNKYIGSTLISFDNNISLRETLSGNSLHHIRDNTAETIINKVNTVNSIKDVLLNGSSYGKLTRNHHTIEKLNSGKNNIYIFYINKGLKKKSISIDYVNPPFSDYKVCMSQTAHSISGLAHARIDRIFIVEPNSITSHSFSRIDFLKSKEAAENCILYMKTDFVNFLFAINTASHYVTSKNYKLVPLIDFCTGEIIDKPGVFLDFSRPETLDEQLSIIYELTEEEQELMRKDLKPWRDKLDVNADR